MSISIFHPGNCVYVFFQNYFISLACFWSIKYINFIHKTPVFSFTPSFCFSQKDTVLSPCTTTSTNVWVQVSEHEIWWLSFLFRSLHSESWEYSAFSSSYCPISSRQNWTLENRLTSSCYLLLEAFCAFTIQANVWMFYFGFLLYSLKKKKWKKSRYCIL